MATSNINFTELFREEREIWIKSLVPGQVSLSFETGQGREAHVLVPYSGDPVCLTDQVPFSAIKTSTDLRKLCNPRRQGNGGLKPAALLLMTAEQAEEHFRKKAVRKSLFKKTPTGDIIKDAEGNPVPDVEAASRPVITEPSVAAPKTQVDFGKTKSEEAMDRHTDIANLGDKPVLIADEINPRVQYWVHQISTAESEKDRPLADVLIDEFESLGELNEASLNHILAFGHYRSVKAWATKQLESVATSTDEE